MNRLNILILITFTILVANCSLKKNDNSEIKTHILGHRAYGVKGYNDTIMDNTLPAVIKAIEITDGVEVDIQMSKDGTIWLYHDTKIVAQDSSAQYIPKLRDQKVLEYLSYNHPYATFNTLEQLLSYFHVNNISKYISLDIKSFYHEKLFKSDEDLHNYMLDLAVKVIALTKKYQLENQVLIESELKFLLDYFNDNSKLKTFLLGFGDFNNHIKIARKRNYTGLSHYFIDPEIDSTSMQYAYKKGLQIQLWTPNSESDLRHVLQLGPDYMQTDHVTYFKDSLQD